MSSQTKITSKIRAKPTQIVLIGAGGEAVDVPGIAA